MPPSHDLWIRVTLHRSTRSSHRRFRFRPPLRLGYFVPRPTYVAARGFRDSTYRGYGQFVRQRTAPIQDKETRTFVVQEFRCLRAGTWLSNA